MLKSTYVVPSLCVHVKVQNDTMLWSVFKFFFKMGL